MRDRFVGERLAAFERASVLDLLTQHREHERPVGVVGGKAVDGGLQHLDLLGVDLSDRAGPAAVVGERRGDEPVGVAELGGAARRVEERFAKRGIAGLALRGAQPDREVDARAPDRSRAAWAHRSRAWA